MKSKKLLRATLLVLAGIVGAWVGIRFLLPVILPFLIGLLLARIAQPAVRPLCERCRFPRWLASGIVVSFLFAALVFLVFSLVRTLWGELSRFTQELPTLLESLAQPMGKLRTLLADWAAKAPESLQGAILQSIDGFFKSGSVVAEQAYKKLFSIASNTIAGLPDLFLFLVTTVISSFMICSQYDAIWAFVSRQVPPAWKNKYEALSTNLKSTLLAWIKAQLKLIGVTFVLLTCGMMLLNISYPLLFGGLIALIDALPLFGTGTVLIPWGLLSFLRGDPNLGIGLVVLYGVAYLTRSTLEPRLVGKQIGLNPLITLLALYAGFRLLGVAGMILFPLGAILLKQFWDHTAPKKAP